jgi:hypothetical protein
MYEPRDSKPSELALDTKNPRLERVEDQQLEILHGLWGETSKMLGLASHIAANGLDPTARLATLKAPSGSGFVVLEGNRRLAALQALADPRLVADTLKPTERTKLERLSKEYLKHPVAKISCALFATREEADKWIELRHSADPTGAGVLMWGAQEKSRFKSRGGTPELAVQIVDLVRNEGRLRDSEKKALGKAKFITTLRRFTNDPEVRTRLGIGTDSAGAITMTSPRGKTVKALATVVADFATRRKLVTDVYHKPDRRNYLASLESAGVLPPQPPLPSGKTAASPLPTAGRGSVTGIRRERRKLFHSGITLDMRQEPRIAKIFKELNSLDIQGFTNAIAVLFRVFIELSVDQYLKRERIMKPSEVDELHSLRKKATAVLTHMQSKGDLDSQQLRAIRRAVESKKGVIGPAHLVSLHSYVHNPHYSPRASDLLAAADEWQPLLEKIWS